MVCIVGAGPFGVSVAAHLQFLGVDFRMFGQPMRRWLTQMPDRMFLKSESCASSLPDPTGLHTLAEYCRRQEISYPEYGTPISRELFANYAISFQQAVVPQVENVEVTAIDKAPEGYELRLSTGDTVKAGKVIIATGTDYMAYMPRELAQLPAEVRSHSEDHHDLSRIRRQEDNGHRRRAVWARNSSDTSRSWRLGPSYS